MFLSSKYIFVDLRESFANPVVTRTVGILDWTVQKLITLVSKQEQNNYIFLIQEVLFIDFIYKGKKGGRGLKSVELWLEGRIIAIRQYQDKKSNDGISNSKRAIPNTWNRKINSG